MQKGIVKAYIKGERSPRILTVKLTVKTKNILKKNSLKFGSFFKK